MSHLIFLTNVGVYVLGMCHENSDSLEEVVWVNFKLNLILMSRCGY